MSATENLHYRAFLSYSHKDQDIADIVHRRLERYAIPGDLKGKSGAFGKLPEKLRPIFRDRYDLEAGHSLKEQVISALRTSEAMIVVCSPRSAASSYVNEEIRQFKVLGRSSRIYPIIVDGEPGDGDNDCFPKALKQKIDDAGRLTDEVDEPIAADLRPQGDGTELAILKLLSGLLGVDLDELRRREAEDQRRQKKFWIGISTAMGVLTVLACIGGVASYVLRDRVVAEKQRNDTLLDATLKRTSGLLQTAVTVGYEHGVPVNDSMVVLENAKGMFADVQKIGAYTPLLPLRQAELQRIFANSYSLLGRTAEQFEAAEKSLELMRKVAAAAAPGDRLAHHELANAWKTMGRAYATRRELTQAMDCYAKALAIRRDRLGGIDATDDDELLAFAEVLEVKAAAHLLRGDKGDRDAALAAASESRKVSERLIETHGATARSIERRGRAIVMLADIHRQAGQDSQALAAVDLGISLELPEGSAGLLSQQRIKASLLEVRGDVYARRRNWSVARDAYTESMAIRQRLSDIDKQNAVQASEVAFSKVKIGEMLMKLDDVDGASAAFRLAAETYEQIIAANKDNQSVARQLMDALDGVCDVARRRRDVLSWTKALERQVEVARSLRQSDDNRFSRRLLASKLSAFAEMELDLRDPVAARPHLTEAAELLQQNAALTAANLYDERDLARRMLECGDRFMDIKRLEEAASCYGDGLRIRRAHVSVAAPSAPARRQLVEALDRAARPDAQARRWNAALALLREAVTWQRGLVPAQNGDDDREGLAQALERQGFVETEKGDAAAAIAVLMEARAIRAGLLEADLANADKRHGLAGSWQLLADAQQLAGDCVAARTALTTAHDLLRDAVVAKPDDVGWSRSLDEIKAALTLALPCAQQMAPGGVVSSSAGSAGSEPKQPAPAIVAPAKSVVPQ